MGHYLAGTALSASSRRVYQISLTSWAWPLVGRRPPTGKQRRGASPPVVPLALLDDAQTGQRLAAAIAERAATTDPRTVNRELSALRSAVGWWQDRQWIRRDPTIGLRHLSNPPAMLPPLTDRQVAEVFGVRVSLREHAFWRIIYDSGAHVADVLALDAGDIDVPGNRGRIRPARSVPAWRSDSGGQPVPLPQAAAWIQWRDGTGQLLGWLLAGRAFGPLFLTDRRAPARTRQADICPITGRARMSYRRAAEIFAECSRPLDPGGRGWTLQQLRHASLTCRRM